MNRRKFLQYAVYTPLALFVGMKILGNARHHSLTDLLVELKRLPAKQLRSSGQWSVSEIFQHCTQSISYSLRGYPQQYSALFQYTAGATALSAFVTKGSMNHPLDEAIPGAPALVADYPADFALAELIREIEQFIAWQGELKPHFAYGALTKSQYYNAHWLHIKNHLSEIYIAA